ncbi:hypothetical protein HHI36_012078 [Cryptolaemus montrouzieri]|uniref:ascorbate ferrireductase (transmembrane) n=1 Tax=Cryptolaemus montrouzieri TaxID=559131 RepID=A0ABD2ND77_9CUCU
MAYNNCRETASIMKTGDTSTVQMTKNQEEKNYCFKLKSFITFSRITNMVHLCAVIFVILILFLALFGGEFVFFTWHPILMSVGWMLLLSEGVLVLNKDNSFLKNIIGTNRIFFHWTTTSVSLVFIVIGFVIAFKNKSDKNKAHFKSWHALFGLLGAIFATLNGFFGVLTLYNRELKNLFSPKLNKFTHILVGTLACLFGGISSILSVYTKWFERKTSDHLTFGIALFLVTFAVIWTLIKPVNSVSKRFQNLISL